MEVPKAKILVIDDEQLIGELLMRYLNKKGYEVVPFTKGSEGIKAAQESSFNLVMVDIRMPGLSGFEVIKELQKSLPHLPIIAMSGSLVNEEVTEILNLGIRAFLNKPFDFQILEKEVKAVLV